MTVRGRLFLSFGLILGVAAIGFVALLRGFRGELIRHLESDLEAQAQSLATEAQDLLNARMESLREQVLTSPLLESALAQADGEIQDVHLTLASRLLRLKRDYAAERGRPTIYRDILLTDALGRTVAVTSQTERSVHRQEPWWRQTVTQGLYVGDAVLDEGTGSDALEVALRLNSPEGDLVGVIEASLPLEEIRSLAAAAQEELGAAGSVELLTGSGSRVFPPRPAKPPLSEPREGPPTSSPEPALEENPGARGLTLRVVGRSPGFSALPESAWTAVLRLDTAAAVTAKAATRRLLLLVAGALALASLLALATSLSFVRPLRRAQEASQRLARGELGPEVDVDARAPGELRRVLAALGVTARKGREVLRRLGASSSRMEKLSRLLQRTAQNLAEGAGEQTRAVGSTLGALEESTAATEALAASADRVSSSVADASAFIEEMAASNERVSLSTMELVGAADRTLATMRGIAASISSVAGHAAEAREASERTVREAAAGHQELEDMIEGMRRISSSMEVIVSVMTKLEDASLNVVRTVGIIDEICEQTDLLAVNAAIQAANAGEHGRTFSVVAREIRKLSERSAAAAGEIGSLISQVNDEMARAQEVTALGAETSREGVRLATRAGKALERIGEAAGDVSSMMLEISAATEEQADASVHVLETVEGMRDLTQDVERSTREQAMGSHQISLTMAEMAQMALEVSDSARSQSSEHTRVAEAQARLGQIATDNAAIAVRVRQMMEELETEARQLADMAALYRTEEGTAAEALSPEVRESPSARPATAEAS